MVFNDSGLLKVIFSTLINLTNKAEINQQMLFLE